MEYTIRFFNGHAELLLSIMNHLIDKNILPIEELMKFVYEHYNTCHIGAIFIDELITKYSFWF